MSDAELRARAQAADLGQQRAPAPGPGGADAPPASSPPAPDPWIEAALRYGAVLRTMIPERARPHWTDDRLRELGLELANCARHYGWTIGGLVNHPLARLGVVAGALAWPIAEPWILEKLKQLQRGERSPAPPADDAPPAPSSPPPGGDAPPAGSSSTAIVKVRPSG